jgi:hypothetical protein
MSSQNIPLKGRIDFLDPAEFRPQRLFAFELRRWKAQLGPSARISAGCLRWQELPRFPRWGHASLRAHRQRAEIVERAAGFGLPHDEICQLIVSERTGKPIDAKTLRSAFRAELDRSIAAADSAVANALYNNAVHSNNVAAQI